MAIVEAHGITKIYGSGEAQVAALHALDLSVETGEFVAIMGPSGSGKSTLLSILGGLDTPTSGTIQMQGAALAGKSERDLAIMRREKIGFIFQAYNLIPVLSAEENVALPLLLAGQKGAALRAKVEKMMELVGLWERRKHMPSQLSGGQQQRVAIARALVTSPALILADEPTGNLDSKTSAEIMAALRRSRDELNQTVMLITHDAAVAAWADRVVFLLDGRIVTEQRLEGPVSARIRSIQAAFEEMNANV